jgi:UDP-glucose 4-epimerase
MPDLQGLRTKLNPTKDGRSMVKVLLTGASGRLGQRLCPALAREKDFQVTAVDVKIDPNLDLGLKIQQANLLDLAQVKALTARQDVVIHMGNHSDFKPPDPFLIFNENVCMNQNVMQSAADAGVKKILAASSIQVMGSVPYHNKDVWDDQPPYLPMDENTPENCRNPYALSKLVGEHMLKYLCRQFDIAGRTIRFPAILEGLHEYEMWRGKKEHLDDYFRPMGYGYLHYDDACELLIRLTRAPITGFGVMFPASRCSLLGMPTQEMVEREFKGVPLRKPVEELEKDGLIDQGHVERDLGWRPVK